MSKLKTTDDLEKAKKYFLKLKKGETSLFFGKDTLTNNLIQKLERLNK